MKNDIENNDLETQCASAPANSDEQSDRAERGCCEAPIKLTKKQNVLHMIKFGLFSASAGIIQLVSFTLLNEVAHLKYWPAYLIALTLSVLYNFTLNRKFTFKSANNVPIAMLQIIAYYAVFTPLSTWWGNALTTRAHWNEYIVLAGTMIINLVTEFIFCRFVVYRNSINTSEAGKNEIERYTRQSEPKESPETDADGGDSGNE